ncbi:hypothetical protein ISN44_As13g012230 [Arabidopsis suecica]|uniref:Transport inhibitor response 1 domain-containing protein n=1 Tax=Arabidopsis suecica TaxID=45249 RepID=A0A8T1XX09_ARASU|nr:hypothetical protein ISN44_As13g012230 [Arabidopsis suecica]
MSEDDDDQQSPPLDLPSTAIASSSTPNKSRNCISSSVTLKSQTFPNRVLENWRVEALTRYEVFIGNCYALSPTRLTQRFKRVRSLVLKGKPRFADFNLMPPDWGANFAPWVSTIAKAYPWLEKVDLKRMFVTDDDLVLLADSFLGFKELILLKMLDLIDSEVTDDDVDWISCFPEDVTCLESLAFDCVEAPINFKALEGLIGRSPFLKKLRLNRFVSLVELHRLLQGVPQLTSLGTSSFSHDKEPQSEQEPNYAAAFRASKSVVCLSGFRELMPEYLSAIFPRRARPAQRGARVERELERKLKELSVARGARCTQGSSNSSGRAQNSSGGVRLPKQLQHPKMRVETRGGVNPQPRTKFIHIVASLEQVLDLKRMGFEDIVGRLLEYEERVGKETQSEDQGPQTLSEEATGSFKKETEAVITRRRYNRGSYNYVGYGGVTGDHYQKKDLSKVMRQGWSSSSCLEISKSTCLQAEGLAEGRAEGLLELIHGEDAGEGHEEDDVMEDITQDNHEDEVGEVVQGVPQLTRSGRQVNQPQYLEDYVMKSETVSGLFQQAYVENARIKLDSRDAITKPGFREYQTKLGYDIWIGTKSGSNDARIKSDSRDARTKSGSREYQAKEKLGSSINKSLMKNKKGSSAESSCISEETSTSSAGSSCRERELERKLKELSVARGARCTQGSSNSSGYANISPDIFKPIILNCHKLQVFWALDSICDEGLQVVAANCKELRELRMFPFDPREDSEGPVPQLGLQAISKGCRKLESILYFCQCMTNAAVIAMSENCPELTVFRLCIMGRHRLDHVTWKPMDEGFSAIVKNCKKLTRLAVSGLLTDQAFWYMGEYGKLVRTLSIAFAGDNDMALRHVLEGCPKLQKLEIRDSPFGDVALRSGMHRYNMRYVWISECSLSKGCCKDIARAMPNLVVEVIGSDDDDDNRDYVETLYMYRSLDGPRNDVPKFVTVL